MAHRRRSQSVHVKNFYKNPGNKKARGTRPSRLLFLLGILAPFLNAGERRPPYSQAFPAVYLVLSLFSPVFYRRGFVPFFNCLAGKIRQNPVKPVFRMGAVDKIESCKHAEGVFDKINHRR